MPKSITKPWSSTLTTDACTAVFSTKSVFDSAEFACLGSTASSMRFLLRELAFAELDPTDTTDARRYCPR